MSAWSPFLAKRGGIFPIPLKCHYIRDTMPSGWRMKREWVTGKTQERPTAKLVQPPTHIRTSATRKVCRVFVIGDSLLRDTKVPIYCPDSISREVGCLPGARIRDVMDGLLSLVKPVDYHPFLLFQVGSNDAAMRQHRNIKRDFKGLGVQVVFSPILQVREGGSRKRRWIEQVNGWLQGCCHAQGLSFYDLGHIFEKLGLLTGDEAQLTNCEQECPGQ